VVLPVRLRGAIERGEKDLRRRFLLGLAGVSGATALKGLAAVAPASTSFPFEQMPAGASGIR
jgi:hypothetical protein